SACAEKGIVKITICAVSQAALFSAPEIARARTPAAPSICWLSLSADSAARFASREPMTTASPALAKRKASPKPSGPVPPTIAIDTQTPAQAEVQQERSRTEP